jgi:hypothetical protein
MRKTIISLAAIAITLGLLAAFAVEDEQYFLKKHLHVEMLID